MHTASKTNPVPKTGFPFLPIFKFLTQRNMRALPIAQTPNNLTLHGRIETITKKNLFSYFTGNIHLFLFDKPANKPEYSDRGTRFLQ